MEADAPAASAALKADASADVAAQNDGTQEVATPDVAIQEVATAPVPAFTLKSAVSFVNSIGCCTAYPIQGLMLPTLVGAAVGNMQALGVHINHIKKHPEDLMRQQVLDAVIRMARNKDLYEVPFLAGTLLASEMEFPYFYSLVGDRKLNQPPTVGTHGEKSLLQHTWQMIEKRGPITLSSLVEKLGRGVSALAVARGIEEMRKKLRIVQIEPEPLTKGEIEFDIIERWAPDLVKQALNISVAEALSALISRYLESVVAADIGDIEKVFEHFAPRSRIADTVRMLVAAREFQYVSVDDKTLVQLTPREKEVHVPRKMLPRAEYLKQKEDAGRDRRLAEKFAAEGGVHRGERVRTPEERDRPRTFEKRPLEKREGGDRPRRDFGGASEGRRPFVKREGGKPFEKREWKPREGGDRPRRDFGGAIEGRRPFVKREGASSFGKSDFKKPYAKREGGRPFEKKEWKPREAGDRPRRDFGGASAGRKPFVKREGGKPFEKREWKPREGGDRPRRDFGGAIEGRRPFVKREGASSFGKSDFKKPYAKREGGRPFEKKEWKPREAGDRPRRDFGGASEGRKPFVKREGRRPFEKKEWKPREGGSSFSKPGFKKPYEKREGGRPFEKKEWKLREGGKPFEKREWKPREGGSSFSKPGFKKPYAKREGGRPFEKKEWKPREGGSSFSKPGFKKPYEKREGGTGKPFEKKEWKPREGGAAKSFGDRKPGGARFGGSKFGGPKPGGKTGGNSFGPRKPGGKSFGAKPGGFKSKFAGKPGSKFTSKGKFDKPKFGAKKPGGKIFKPKREEEKE